MDQTPPPIPNPQPEIPALPRMSLFARLLNVFAVPGHVFEDVRNSSRSLANWLVPLFLATLIGAATFINIARPALLQELRKDYKTVTDKQVKDGKIQQGDADNALVMIDWVCKPDVIKIGTMIGSLVLNALQLLLWAFLLWWLGRVILKAPFSFSKALEISGLATMISVLAATATLALTANFSSDAAHALTLDQLEARAKMPVRIVLANVFSIWFVGVLASGLSRFTGSRFTRAMMLVLGCWILLQFLIGLFAVGMTGLMR
jgi:hypothetical protein